VLKILFKAAVLFLIVISIYLIVNPHACSNMLVGQERNMSAEEFAAPRKHPMAEPGRDLAKPQRSDPVSTDELLDSAPEQAQAETAVAIQPSYSQQDMDYAIAKRYVELEREHASNQKMGKDKSRELSYIVMQDFELTPDEWNAFLARATASGLFEKVRQESQTATEPEAK